MESKLTFKKFLEQSKEQLLRAIDQTPVTVYEYEVKKYCTIFVGETENEKVGITLKPKNKVLVEWKYDDPTSPTPVSVQIDGAKGINKADRFSVFWTNNKLQKWLTRHANEGINSGHKT